MSPSTYSKTALWAFLFVVSLFLSSATSIQYEILVEYGIKMFTKASRGVCWVENQHKTEKLDNHGLPFDSCYANMRLRDNEWQKRYVYHEGYQKKYSNNPDTVRQNSEKFAMQYLKSDMKTNYLTKLPSVYRNACEQYVDNEKEKPVKDYSTILQDSSKGDYPFRGLAHCLIGEIEQNNKADDLESLNSYWLNPEPFMEAIEYGLQLFAKAGRGVCWVENQYKSSKIENQRVAFDSCYSQLRFRNNEWQIRFDFYSDYHKKQHNETDTIRELSEEAAMKYLKSDLTNYLTKLPASYKSACEQFVDDAYKKPAKDYSTVLQDSLKGDYPFKGLTHCIIGTIELNNKADDLVALQSHWLHPNAITQDKVEHGSDTIANQVVSPPPSTNSDSLNPNPEVSHPMNHVSPLHSNAEDIQYGIDMFAKVGRGVCWVEKQHKLYPIDLQGAELGVCCSIYMTFKENEWKSRYDTESNYLKSHGRNPDTIKDFAEQVALNHLKSIMKSYYLAKLPYVYKPACEKFVDDAYMKPAKDYSTILQDSSKGDYPFRGLAHCLIGEIENNNKADDLVALKSHWLNPKPFLEAIIGRENENRARHGVPMLTLHPELTKRAQRYADELARICKMIHMVNNPDYGRSHPDQWYNGGQTAHSFNIDEWWP